MFPYLVADIGGSNARLALVTCQESDTGFFRLEERRDFECRDLENIQQLLSMYLDSLGDKKLHQACLAVAAPVNEKLITMTNLNWQFDPLKLQHQVGLLDLKVINDFSSLAVATLFNNHEMFEVIKPGRVIRQSTSAVIGPGTGLGVGALVHAGDSWGLIEGEGGHITLAPVDSVEFELIKVAQQYQAHVSAEYFLSGPGIFALYKCLAEVNGVEPEPLTQELITQKALDRSDPLCVDTIRCFFNFLGTVTGDIALTLGATGGIYIGGGILQRISRLLIESHFVERFNAKGVMSPYINNIQINLFTRNDTALQGAAMWMSQQYK